MAGNGRIELTGDERQEIHVTMNPQAPIGVFDSGLGGLAVLREVRRLLPHENVLFLGDTLRMEDRRAQQDAHENDRSIKMKLAVFFH